MKSWRKRVSVQERVSAKALWLKELRIAEDQRSVKPSGKGREYDEVGGGRGPVRRVAGPGRSADFNLGPVGAPAGM